MVVLKQFLRIYDKPMIYFLVAVLMLAGIPEILMISTPTDLPRFEQLLGEGSKFGILLNDSAQIRPNGVAVSFIIGRQFTGSDPVTLVLGENSFHGAVLSKIVRAEDSCNDGATALAYAVDDAERYGVVEFDSATSVACLIEEKPAVPRLHWAVTGLYSDENEVLDIAPGQLQMVQLDSGFDWLDSGTHDSLYGAPSNFCTIEKRQGDTIMCLDEIALELGCLTPAEVVARADSVGAQQIGDLSPAPRGRDRPWLSSAAWRLTDCSKLVRSASLPSATSFLKPGRTRKWGRRRVGHLNGIATAVQRMSQGAEGVDWGPYNLAGTGEPS